MSTRNEDDFLFDENGNLNATHSDKPEVEAEPRPDSRNQLDTEIAENRAQLQERIAKLTDLIENKDTYGFTNDVIRSFNSQIEELKTSLNGLDHALTGSPVAEAANDEKKPSLMEAERMRQEQLKQADEEESEEAPAVEEKPLQAMSLTEIEQYKAKQHLAFENTNYGLSLDLNESGGGKVGEVYQRLIEENNRWKEKVDQEIEAELSRRHNLDKAFGNRSVDNDEVSISVKNSTPSFKERIQREKETISQQKENKKNEEDERPWYKKLGSITDYFSDGIKAETNAKPTFLEEYRIHDMFGDDIEKVINRSNSRVIHFKDKTSIMEKGQEITAKGNSYINIADKVSQMAVAKGWKSITFEGNDVFMSVAYEKATKMGLVVEPQNEAQDELFKRIHKAKGLDVIMPYSGMKHEEVQDKEIEVPEVKAMQGQRMRM